MSNPTDATPPDVAAGALLRALREAHAYSAAGLALRGPNQPALTQDQLSKLTYEAAERSGGRLKGLGRTYIVNIEAGRNDAQTDRVRAVLAAVYDLTRDQLADYLDAVTTLAELLANKAKPPRSTRPPSRAGAPPAGSHGRWAAMVEEVKKMEPGVSEETFEIIAAAPWPYGNLDRLDAYALAKVALAVQTFRNRTGDP